jgi:protoheme IX farnesyltransferase
MRTYLELTKPRITWLILMSTGVGYFFGAHGNWQLLVIVHTLMGTGLIASGTATLNQWYEREADARMRRTKNRPIPSGRIQAPRALVFGIALSLLGFLELAVGVNLLTGILGLLTLTSYLFLYTPLKQRSPVSTTVGAFPGAMPPLIGYAAASGTLTAEALVLYVILFLWQFPHFLSIAWMYRADYARAGIVMLPVVEPDGKSTTKRILLYSLALIPISVAPSFLSMSGKVYLVGALLLSSMYFFAGIRAALDRTAIRVRQVLLASVVYLPLLYSLMILDRRAL